jgi:hypothetical protein
MIKIPLTAGALKASLIANAVLVVLAIGVGLFQQYRIGELRTELATAKTDLADVNAANAEEREKFIAAAKAAERDHAQKMLDIGALHQKEKDDAKAQADAVVADLRSGLLRLHARWEASVATAALVSEATAGTREPDAAALDRYESAGRIVRAADECDAQVRGLQAVVLACSALSD